MFIADLAKQLIKATRIMKSTHHKMAQAFFCVYLYVVCVRCFENPGNMSLQTILQIMEQQTKTFTATANVQCRLKLAIMLGFLVITKFRFFCINSVIVNILRAANSLTTSIPHIYNTNQASNARYLNFNQSKTKMFFIRIYIV